MSASLVWECIRNQNSFMRKSKAHGVQVFSAEAGNLYNLHSYKYSGTHKLIAYSRLLDGL